MPLVRTFTENLMAYAFGRRVEYYDEPTVRAIATRPPGERLQDSSFVLGIVKSDPFRMKRAETSRADGTTAQDESSSTRP